MNNCKDVKGVGGPYQSEQKVLCDCKGFQKSVPYFEQRVPYITTSVASGNLKGFHFRFRSSKGVFTIGY